MHEQHPRLDLIFAALAVNSHIYPHHLTRNVRRAGYGMFSHRATLPMLDQPTTRGQQSLDTIGNISSISPSLISLRKLEFHTRQNPGRVASKPTQASSRTFDYLQVSDSSVARCRNRYASWDLAS
jgi:hypothetical protein